MKTKDFINGKVTYDNYGQYFWINTPDGQQMLAELRGWGHIQNIFKDKSGGINSEEAGKFQDEIGEWIAKAINEKIEREQSTPDLPSDEDVKEFLVCECGRRLVTPLGNEEYCKKCGREIE